MSTSCQEEHRDDQLHCGAQRISAPKGTVLEMCCSEVPLGVLQRGTAGTKEDCIDTIDIYYYILLYTTSSTKERGDDGSSTQGAQHQDQTKTAETA